MPPFNPFANPTQQLRQPSDSVAHRTLSGLDGAYNPLPTVADPFWAANPGGKQTARFFLDLVIRATTGLNDDPVITVRPFVRHGGSSGYVGAGESVSFARPRLKDLSSIKAQFTTDGGSTYTDNSANVIDNTTGVMTLNSLDTVANGDWIVLGGPTPFMGVALDYTNLNSNDATLSVEYWNGSAWVAVSNLLDGTIASSTKTAGADGQVTWSMPTDWAASTINGIAAYYVRLGVSAAIDSSVTLTEVDLLLPVKAVIDVQADGDDATVMLEALSGAISSTPAYSGTTRVSWR